MVKTSITVEGKYYRLDKYEMTKIEKALNHASSTYQERANRKVWTSYKNGTQPTSYH